MATGVREIGEFDLTMEKAAEESGLSLKNFYARVTQSMELAKALLALAMRIVFALVAKVERDMTGWKCVGPVEAEEGEFEVALHEFLKPEDKGCVGGEKMIKRGKKKELPAGYAT